jgi:hypothetical protein
MIYKDENGQRYLALSDEDLDNLDWNPKELLQLDNDGVGWIIKPATCNLERFIPNDGKRD